MEVERRGGFHFMRYVVAMLGSIALAILSMLEYTEKDAEWRYHYNMSSRMTQTITILLTIAALALAGAFYKKVSAKWAMVAVMATHAFHALLYVHIHDDRLVWSIAVLTQIIRVIGVGVCSISLHALISKWSPPDERSAITSIVHVGIPMAALCVIRPYEKFNIDVMIICTIIWIMLWCYFVDDSPEKKRCVSQDEREYIRILIENYWPRPDLKDDTSIRSIIRSKAFVAIVLVECCNSLIQILMSTRWLSTDFEQSTGGTIGQIVVALGCGIGSTVLLQKKIVTFDLARKIPSIIAIAIPMPFIIIAIASRVWSLRKITSFVTYAIMGAKLSGTMVNIIDISPTEAPLFMAITQIINQVFILITHLMTSYWHVYPLALADTIMLAPTTILIIVAALQYWRWGSTAQKGVVSSTTDTSAGQIFTYGPLSEGALGSMKV